MSRAAWLCCILAAAGHAQDALDASQVGRPDAAAALPAGQAGRQVHGDLLLALPFDNDGSDPSVDWIGSAFPELMDQRFASAGFLPVSRGDRMYALEHLGLPADFQQTRASTLRLAQTLDVDDVIFGSYTVTNGRITATARVLDVNKLTESAPLTQAADLAHLTTVIDSLAWMVARQLDPAYPVAEQTFIAADANLRLDAFEDYIRGLVQGTLQDRITHLRQAVSLAPDYGRAWLALGNTYFAAHDYDSAALAYGHLTRNDPDALQADFHRGLAYFFTGKYLPAEDAFAFVSTRLPLPEVVNDEGVAAARRGKNAVPFFQQAITEDPHDAEYRLNLALSFARQGNTQQAEQQAAEALKLRPDDTEIQTFLANLKTPGFLTTADADAAASIAAGAEPAANALPLERIKRSYDEAAFRQAAFEMDQMQALRAASEPKTKEVAGLLSEGDQYLNAGLLVEAEREYNSALGLDPASAGAYSGLARIRERTSEHAAAAQLAQKSLGLKDNAEAHLVLARLALGNNQVPEAAAQVAAALRVAPGNTEAAGLRQAVIARGGQLPQ